MGDVSHITRQNAVNPDVLRCDCLPHIGQARCIDRAAAKLGITEPRLMMRKGEAEYKAQELSQKEGHDLIIAMAATPKLIERPIVETATAARIGRPPEAVMEIV